MGGTGGKGWTGRTGGKGRNERKSARGAGAALRLKGRRFMKKLRHHSLVAWQRADDLFIKLHQLTLHAFPSHERFELGSQMRRAAITKALRNELEVDLARLRLNRLLARWDGCPYLP